MTRSNRTALGLLAVVPALIALVVSYAWPTVWTVWASFAKGSFLGSPSTASGNWRAVGDGFGDAIKFSLLIAVVPLLAVLVVAPLLAWAAARAGKPLRWGIRGVLALALVTVAPMALAASWFHDQRLLAVGYLHRAWPVWVTTFALATALAATAYLAALRRRGVPGAVVVVAVVSACAVLAFALQTYTLPSVAGPSPIRSPNQLLYVVTFQQLSLGRGAAVATVLLLILAVLGVTATLALILSGARVEPVEAGQDEPVPHPLAAVGAVAGGVVVLGVLIFALWPWLKQLGHGEIAMPAPKAGGVPSAPSAFGILARTWLPQLAPALVGAVLATLAGYGIGALRPLGRRSELLLLIFAPWLFVGLGPLLPHAFSAHPGQSSIRPIPLWLNIPLLFLVAFYCRGQYARRAAGAPAGRPTGALLRGGSLVALVFLATWVSYAQDSMWALTVGQLEHPTGIVAVFLGAYSYVGPNGHTGVGLASPPPVLFLLLLGLLAVQVLTLDRLRLATGALPPESEAPAVPAVPPTPGTVAGWPQQPGAYPQQPAAPQGWPGTRPPQPGGQQPGWPPPPPATPPQGWPAAPPQQSWPAAPPQQSWPAAPPQSGGQPQGWPAAPPQHPDAPPQQPGWPSQGPQ